MPTFVQPTIISGTGSGVSGLMRVGFALRATSLLKDNFIYISGLRGSKLNIVLGVMTEMPAITVLFGFDRKVIEGPFCILDTSILKSVDSPQDLIKLLSKKKEFKKTVDDNTFHIKQGVTRVFVNENPEFDGVFEDILRTINPSWINPQIMEKIIPMLTEAHFVDYGSI